MNFCVHVLQLKSRTFAAVIHRSKYAVFRENVAAFKPNKLGKSQFIGHRSKNSFCTKPHVVAAAASVTKLFNVERVTTAVSSAVSTDASHRRRNETKPVLPASIHVVDHDQYDDVRAGGKLFFPLIDRFPAAIQPYLRLMRLDKPIGTWLLFWPCAWSIGFATSPVSLPDIYLLAVFGAGSIVMRGAGCAINDMWDSDIDAKVARTTSRPIASGQISQLDAAVFLLGLVAVGDLIVLQLNTYCVLLGMSSLGLVATYPLMKRITNWPQLFLGIVFNWGALMGWAAVRESCDFAICLPLYAACVSWTLIYDTIYAHQDKKDDALCGVRSTALYFGSNTKTYLTGFATTMVAGFVATGIMSDQTVPYYLAVGLAASHIVHQIVTLNTEDPQQCGEKFASNYVLGFMIMAGIIASTLMKNRKDLVTTELSGKIEIAKRETI